MVFMNCLKVRLIMRKIKAEFNDQFTRVVDFFKDDC